ncbi:MAG: hypothetical protein ACK5F7_00915, partial [Planctomycetaceae bacterium]
TLWVDPSGMVAQHVSVSIDINDELPSSGGNQGPQTFWQGYCHYLNNPSAMDPELEGLFYVAGGVGLAAGAVAGGALIAGSVTGTALLGAPATLVTAAGAPTVAGNAVIGMGSAGLIGGTISHIQGGGFIKGGVIAAPAGFIGGGASSLASTLLARAGVSGLAGAIAADGFGGAAAGAADSQLRGNTLTKTVQAALYGFVAGGLLRAGLSCAGPWIQASWTRLLNRTPKRVDPKSVAAHPTFKPGPHAAGSIPAASSAKTFTAAERAAVDAIGYKTGCHTCGTKSPGTKTGHFVPDHQPPTKINDANLPQKLYPHCLSCSKKQGLAVARDRRTQ